MCKLHAQTNLRTTLGKCEDERINKTLAAFENPASAADAKNAWNLVKKLARKETKSVFIQGENRLGACRKNHFKNLLNADPQQPIDNTPI